MEKKLLQGLSELAKFLGGKFDKLREDINDGNRKLKEEIRDSQKSVQLDLTTRSIEKLQESSDLNINKVAKALEDVAKAEGARLVQVTNAITQLEAAVRRDTTDNPVYKEIAASLKALVEASKNDKSDTALTNELKAGVLKLAQAIYETAPEYHEADYSEICQHLELLAGDVRDLKDAVMSVDARPAILGLSETVSGMKLNVPSTFKIDDNQMRLMKTSGGIGGVGVRTATNITVANVSLTATDTEYSYTFPANTISFMIKLRDQGAQLYYSFETGTLPSSGDGSSYMTLFQGVLRSQDNVEWSRKTIYLGSDTASQVAEIEVHTM